MKLFRIGITLLIAFNSQLLIGQSGSRAEYIKAYSEIAIDEMNRSGVPASITLAQGILESGVGQSELARKSNNHFGIKCHSSWTGERVYHDDDEKGECFRKYEDVRHSFEDHTDFLVRGSRYDFLFDLDPNDYKGWAIGLKKAGYATSPDYADRLIKIIEDEMLFAYDQGQIPGMITSVKQNGPVLNTRGKPVKNKRERFIIRRMQRVSSRVPYVVLQQNERIEYLADSLRLPLTALLQFNDLSWESDLEEGDRIYIDEKKGRGAEKTTTVRQGETMHDVSQREQVKLYKLYKFNKFNVGYQPMVGDEIRLRPVSLIERFKGQ